MYNYKKVIGSYFDNELPKDTFWYVKEVGMWHICSPYIRSIWKKIKDQYQNEYFYTPDL